MLSVQYYCFNISSALWYLLSASDMYIATQTWKPIISPEADISRLLKERFIIMGFDPEIQKYQSWVCRSQNDY